MPKSLPPPKLRIILLSRLEVYAGDLFKLEADNYSEYKSKAEYPAWLSRLMDRVIARVFNTIQILERAKEPATLAYHGVTDDEVRADLRLFLLEVANTYIWDRPSPQVLTEAAQPAAQASVQPTAPVPYPEPLAQQLRELRDECDITAETMAEALGVDPRSIYKHLAGQTVPRRNHIDAYEKLFSERLNRPVILKRSVKGQRIKSKRSVKGQ